MVEILQNFVAFSEYMNFNKSVCIAAKMDMRRADVDFMTKAFMLNATNVHK